MTTTWEAARRWRLSRQYLLQGASDPVEVIARLTTVPSWLGDPEIAVALRMEAPTPGAVESALAEGRLVRTYSYRGSTHLMRPQDAGAVLALRAAGRQWERKSWREFYRLTADDWPDLRAVVREALSAGPLTQQELADRVSAVPRFSHLSSAFTHRSHTFLKPFAWQGDLILGPTRDGRITLQALDGHPGWTGPVELDEAGPRVILDYLAAYGPASPDRLHYWMGEGLSAGRRRIESWIHGLRDRTALLDVGGDQLLCRAEDAAGITATTRERTVVFLPGWDQWVLGPGTADARIVPAPLRTFATRGANLVLVDGIVRGTWAIGKDALEVVLPGFGDADPTMIEGAASRVLTALDRSDLGTVVVR